MTFYIMLGIFVYLVIGLERSLAFSQWRYVFIWPKAVFEDMMYHIQDTVDRMKW